MKLLLDEHISPTLVRRLADCGVFALSIVHCGLGGKSDAFIWEYALQNDFAVVTTNVRDFIEFTDQIHSGLILLRQSGLSREEQRARLEPVVLDLLAREDSSESESMMNYVVEVWELGKFQVRRFPAE